MEAVHRKAQIYELVVPMQVALLARCFGSEFLTRQYNHEVSLVRSTLQSILPEAVVADKTCFAAIEGNHACATWRRVREDQSLSVEAAPALQTAVFARMSFPRHR